MIAPEDRPAPLTSFPNMRGATFPERSRVYEARSSAIVAVTGSNSFGPLLMNSLWVDSIVRT
jgi:hypothetical protein